MTQPRRGTLVLRKGRYDSQRDSIFVTVESFDLQPGDEIEFERAFFEHPTLFGETMGTQIARSIDKLTKAVLKK